MKILNMLQSQLRPLVESATSYISSFVLFLQDLNYAAVGALILFIARAAVDIPRAIDYWKERKAEKNDRQDKTKSN